MKKIKIQLTINMEHEVSDEWDDAQIKWHLEGNYCIDNFIEKLYKQIEDNDGVCQTCNVANVKVIDDLDLNSAIKEDNEIDGSTIKEISLPELFGFEDIDPEMLAAIFPPCDD